MQLMCDALAVLGSRHGVVWNPPQRCCQLVRFDHFIEAKSVNIRAGVTIDGKEYLLPLCEDGGQFSFHDQRQSPCTMTLIGIDPGSRLKLKLTMATPFRPKDVDFSTTPVLAIRLELEKMPGFRWDAQSVDVTDAEIFLEFIGDDIAVEPAGEDAIDFTFNSARKRIVPAEDGGLTFAWDAVPQHDRLVVTDGQRHGTRFVQRVGLSEGEAPASLTVAWCTYSAPMLEFHDGKHPFKYAERFTDLNAVADWARTRVEEIFTNATRVDGIIVQNNCSKSVNHLLANTLHSWLINTWWINRDGRDWFSVWEGSCHFHSTVDVEYTQAPFYLAVWPELLKIELEFWPEYSKDGTLTLGDRGAGTRFLSHDAGWTTDASKPYYPHEMEVEETTNYLILSYAYWRRTGDDTTIRKHAEALEQYLAFLAACDTTGNGIPNMGVANTIDDASPAVQFGREQVYLVQIG